MKSPCHNCGERYVGCHSVCEKYQVFNQFCEEQRQKRAEYYDKHDDAWNRDHENKYRRKIKKGR